jgi:hypothetical protein
MSTVEVSNTLSLETIQKTLFSKDNISGINKILLEKFNLGEISKDNKKKVIDILIKNMKSVYKSLDLKKINEHNFQSIIKQFNKLSFEHSSKTLGNDDVLSMLIPNASQKKFERDFNSNPNSGNRLMERPQSVSHKNQNQFLYPPDHDKNMSRKPDSRFDKLFKPIVDDLDENYKFNQYQTGKGGDEFSNRFDKLKEDRNSETIVPQRPQTPDFLKPMNTSVRPQMDRNMSFDSRGNGGNSNNKFSDRGDVSVRKRTGRPNFSEKIPEDELDTGFLSSNDNQDFYDINNIDQSIDIKEIQEDKRSFEQRLQSLQTERGHVQIQKPAKNINFQDPNLDMNERNNEVEEEIPAYQPTSVEDLKKQKKLQFLNERHERKEERQQQPRRVYNEEQEDEEEQEESEEAIVIKPKKKIMESNVKLTSSNERKVNMKKIKELLKNVGGTDTAELLILKKENDSLKKKLSQLGDLDNKNQFEYVKKEIGVEFSKLNEKEKEIHKKESEIKELLKKYNFLYGLRHIQIDISPPIPESNYVFEFNTINNVAAIKLMSYSIPQARFNLEDDKNNMLKINKDGEEIEIKLNSGKYKIEDILNILNKKGKFNFELNFEQKVEVKHEENFDIIPTGLSKEVLGFTSPCTKNNAYEADKTWDLRIEDKIYLFITNLSADVPFAVIYLGNQAVQQFKFEEPINLEKLELSFRDSKGRPYNFYGLHYSINLQLEINDPQEE